MQFVDFLSADNRMACVGTPLITDHDIVARSEEIDQFAFGLIAPLKTDHAGSRHKYTLIPICPARQSTGTPTSP